MATYCRRLVLLIAASLAAFNWAKSSAGTSHAAECKTNAASWAQAARNALRPSSATDIAAARLEATGALAALRDHLATLPAGAAIARELALDRLPPLLDAATPDSAALRDAAIVLRGYRPGAVHAHVIRLRAAIDAFAREADATPDAIAEASRAIDFFDQPDGQLQSLDGDKARQAFATLARLPRFEESLEALRARASRPNVRLAARTDYLLALARREFTIPISFRTNLKNTELSVAGSVRLKTLLELPANDRRAELRIAVSGNGQLELAGSRGAIAVCANARPCARAAHGFAFGQAGVEVGKLELDFSNRTTLSGVSVDAPIGGRLAGGVLRRVLSRRLPELDRKAARTIEEKAQARIADECADIAFRLNGLFDEQIVARLAGRDVEARPRYSSSPTGIQFEASYARRDQLAALAPPPSQAAVELGERDYTMWLHESAIDNLRDGLANARLDESLYWMLLGEELKLEAAEAPPVAAVRATLTLAASEPLHVDFDDGAVSLTFKLSAFSTNGVEQRGDFVALVKYRIAAANNGLRLARDGAIESPNAPAELMAVLERFFPAELRPKQRFRNNSFSQWLAIERAVLDDGWLAIGIDRHSSVTPAQQEATP